jgi:undecaprenyl-diphosphatase
MMNSLFSPLFLMTFVGSYSIFSRPVNTFKNSHDNRPGDGLKADQDCAERGPRQRGGTIMGLSELDTKFFFWVNQGHRNPFFDRIMPYITEFDHWKYWLLLVGVLLFILGGKKIRMTLVFTGLLIGILDYTNSFFFKPFFARPRPCNALTGVHLFWPCPRSFSFPSNHAANIFGGAFFLSHHYKRWAFLFIATAVVVGYSRVYVGEHYPFDVFGGALLGAIGAAVFIGIYGLFINNKLSLFPLLDRKSKG